ncbi:hypothetical protein ACFO3D_18815 [Virgibacillus kekensis]|uniref:Uncharacterized protein n=1 Tax=Virgibacillus kekensis TaxID=202261 RepID=A0ABV9DNK1_9BACI
MKIDMDMNMEIKGKVDKEITIPENVKNNAQVITMDQLQQAQQSQQP